MHGGDWHLFAGGEAGELPDLFNPDLARWPQLARARLYAGEQAAGDICFNPSLCLHAVVNVELPLTISLTHNYVDASNVVDAALDALADLRSDLAMYRDIGRDEARCMFETDFDASLPVVLSTLATLQRVFEEEELERIIEFAATDGGRCAGDADVQAVRELLRAHIEQHLLECGMRPQWEAAFADLIGILT